MSVHRLKTTTQAVKWKVKAKPYGGKRQALTQDELDRLFAALKSNRHGHRDYMVALVTFLHGLRVSELIDLRWDDIDWRKGTIAIRRLKGSIDGTHSRRNVICAPYRVDRLTARPCTRRGNPSPLLVVRLDRAVQYSGDVSA